MGKSEEPPPHADLPARAQSERGEFPDPVSFGAVLEVDDGVLAQHRGRAHASVTISDNGRWAWCNVGKGGEPSYENLWDLTGRRKVRRLDRSDIGALSPDGRRILRGGPENTLILCDANSDEEIRRFVGHSEAIVGLSFFPDGRRFVSIANDGWALVWDMEARGRGHDWVGSFRHKDRPNCLAVSPDGSRLATGDEDGRVSAWDVKTGEPVGRVPRLLDRFGDAGDVNGAIGVSDKDEPVDLGDVDATPVNRLAFFMDGRRLAVATGDARVLVFDVEAGRLLAEHREGNDDSTELTALAVSATGHRILFASYAGPIQVWDWTAGKITAMLAGHFRIVGVQSENNGPAACEAW